MRDVIEKSTAHGQVKAPPSKSASHRLLIAAGLANGRSKVKNIALSEDIKATIDALSAFGAKCSVNGDTVTVEGGGLENIGSIKKTVNCRESGSTLRFFIPLGLLFETPVEFTGYGRLLKRPMTVYEDICSEQGLEFSQSDEKILVKGRLKSGTYNVRGDISSQFITGLLFALPMLQGDSVINIIPPVESRPYIDMTLKALSDFGIEYKFEGNVINIPGGQRYCAREITVEGDYSNAAFLEALKMTGGDVEVTGLDPDSIQGDKAYIGFFKDLRSGGRPELDISQCPDLGPVLMGMAALCGGAVLNGTKRLRIKESDRGQAMKEELLKFGIEAEIYDNHIVVKGGVLKKPEETLDPHNDHRIAMTLALLASVTGGEIENAQCVNKSYPAFWEDIKKLGIKVGLYDD